MSKKSQGKPPKGIEVLKEEGDQIVATLTRANPDVIAELLDVLQDAMNKWLETRELDFTDAFMAAHNFHKLIVMNIAEDMKTKHPENTGFARQVLFQCAAETFHMAMRECAVKAMRQGMN